MNSAENQHGSLTKMKQMSSLKVCSLLTIGRWNRHKTRAFRKWMSAYLLLTENNRATKKWN